MRETLKASILFQGGNIASAWAAMKALGESGYMAKAREIMDITDKMKARITSIKVPYRD